MKYIPLSGIRPRRVAVVAHASQHFYPILDLTFKKVKKGEGESEPVCHNCHS